MAQDVRDEVPAEVGGVDSDADEAGDEDAGEDDANDAEGEAVHGWVDEGEDFEEGVVDAVDDGCVEVHEGDGWVFDCDFDGFDERVEDYGGGFQALLVYFRLGLQAGVVCEGAEAGGAAEEDVGCGGFGDEEEHEDEDGAGDPEDFPEGPAPAFGGNGEAGEERSEGGTAVSGCDPDCKGVGKFEEGVHVLHCCSAVG